jgi:hypothetical protein
MSNKVKEAPRGTQTILPAQSQALAVQDAPTDLEPLIDPAMQVQAARVDTLAGRYARAIEQAPGHVEKATLMARGLNRLRDCITPAMMNEVMQLMNSPLGFMTDKGTPRARDKDRDPYPVAVVKECLIEALLHGLHIAGNEWNILAGRCYVTLNGWKRKFETLPGITDVNESPGMPRVADGQTAVRVALSWKLDGVLNMLRDQKGEPGRVFPIIVTGYSSADQTIGKARRKAYKAAYEKATGSVCTAEEGDVSDGPALAGPTKTDALLSKLVPAKEPAADGPATDVQRMQVEQSIADFQIGEERYLVLCEEANCPPDLSRATLAQAARLLEKLHAV